MSIRMRAVTQRASSPFLAGLLVCLSSFAMAQPSNVPDLTGEWRIVGNNHRGKMVVAKQTGARFSGRVYNQRMVDGIIAGNTISFTRMWNSGKLRQDFTGELTIGADGKGTITGTFTQNFKSNFRWTATSVAPLRRASSNPGESAGTGIAPPPQPPSRRQKQISVVAGTYGGNCSQPRGNKTPHLAKACNGKQRCPYVIDYKVIGDPARGCAKTYVAEWRCGSSRQIYRAQVDKEAGYRKTVTLTCPGPGPASPAPPQPSARSGRTLPIDISGSWSHKGSRNQVGRVNIWQNGQRFTVIASWPGTDANHKAGIWKSYKGEGVFRGRQMVFKVMPSNRDGRSADQGYVYYWTISNDNSRITGYYTRHGKRTTDRESDYYKVK